MVILQQNVRYKTRFYTSRQLVSHKSSLRVRRKVLFARIRNMYDVRSWSGHKMATQ